MEKVQMNFEPIILFALEVLAYVSIYLIVNEGLNIQLGVTGITQFGLVFAVSGGAFTAGYLATRAGVWMFHINTGGLDFINGNIILTTEVNSMTKAQPLNGFALLLIVIIVAGIVGALLGIISSVPAINLRSDYLGITLLAFGEILNVFGTAYTPLIGGPPGVIVPDVWAWAGGNRFVASTFTLVALAGMAYLYIEYVIRSPLGRTMRAIRDNEAAAQSLGKNLPRCRLEAIVIGSVLASIGGALFVLYAGSVTPTLTRYTWTFIPWLMLLLGGLGSNVGTLVGTATWFTLYDLILYYKFYLQNILPFDVVWLNYILLGIIVMLILIFRPQGLIPEKPLRAAGAAKSSTQ
jgi:branched-chain amino acid transport system permease protein